MNDFKGLTTNEDKMFKGIQNALNIYTNGWIGTQTMSSLAMAVGADCFPLTLELYGQPCIICKDILPFNPKSGVKNFKNTLSGSFSDTLVPVSILIQDGEQIRGHSCHFWEGYPESVIYKTIDDKIGIARVKTINELPKLKWAVGGMGLLDNYNPQAEGFVGKFSDVLRTTNHTVLGEKNGYFYLLYLKSMSATQINTFCKNKLMLDKAILLDGGHIAAINGDEAFAKINTSQKQLYAIQAR